MKHTRPSTMIIFAVIGVVGGWFLDAALAAMGEPVVVPPYSLAVVLTILAVLVVVAAVPVRRAVKDGTRVDPFYAMRVVVLAKASTLTASLLAGGAVGILVYLLSRPVVPGPGSALMALAAAGGAIALLVGGLIAERMCTVPPEDEDKDGPAGVTAA
ncbi:DUF3180 domain-containing protein [Lysobacter korlensis]|uniref:DUF3180 domain-containing protein n=1 Tax=Lysobacter korlensis TaxID=553636 RepID=A0ABV6RUA0_9GAMM